MDARQEEQIKLEHATLLEEYKLIRENVLAEVRDSRQVINLTISAAGIFIAASPFIIQEKLHVIFLVAPLIFVALALAQLRYLCIDRRLSAYQLEVLVPRLRQTIKQMSPETAKSYDSLLSWEAYFNASEYQNLILLPLSAGNLGVNLLAILMSIGAYFIASGAAINSMPLLDLLLLTACGLAFLYIIASAIWLRFPQVQKKVPTALRRHAG